MTQVCTEIYSCTACGKEVKGHHRFCHSCGEYLGYDAEQISLFNNTSLQSAFSFFIIYLAICLIVHFTNWFDAYDHLFWVELFLTAVTLIYVWINFAGIKPLLRFKNFSLAKLTGCIWLAVVASLTINIIVSKLNISFFGIDTGYYSRYSIYTMPVLVMIYSIALNPAIFEELAFRGVIYNYLNTFLNERLVVIVTGITFAVMHLNFISLIWLIPFGVLVGAMRKRFGTIWYGIIFHFTFNFTAVFFDLFKQGKLWFQ